MSQTYFEKMGWPVIDNRDEQQRLWSELVTAISASRIPNLGLSNTAFEQLLISVPDEDCESQGAQRSILLKLSRADRTLIFGSHILAIDNDARSRAFFTNGRDHMTVDAVAIRILYALMENH